MTPLWTSRIPILLTQRMATAKSPVEQSVSRLLNLWSKVDSFNMGPLVSFDEESGSASVSWLRYDYFVNVRKNGTWWVCDMSPHALDDERIVYYGEGVQTGRRLGEFPWMYELLARIAITPAEERRSSCDMQEWKPRWRNVL